MIRIAIVEDEDLFAGELEAYLEKFRTEHGQPFSIMRYADGEEIVQRYAGEETEGYDLILMDIQMKQMDGMTAAEHIRKKDSDVVLIFITNRADYAIRGYQVDALDYVLKPINYISFEQKMLRALERINSRRAHRITINTRNGMLRMDVSELYYVESQGHQLIYHTARGVFSVRERMQDVEEKLLPYEFFRSNKGYLVNLRHVDGVKDGCCLVHGDELLISRARRSEFMAALTGYIGKN